MWNFVKGGFALVGLALVVGLSLDSFKVTPENAIIYIDPTKKLYYSPLCVHGKTPTSMEQLLALEFPEFMELDAGRYRDIAEKDYQTPNECKGLTYWFQENRSMTGNLFQKVGILKPLPNRWNPDGTWNY